MGNRLSRQKGTDTAETYSYNYLNQLTRVQQGTAVTTYTYDERGNQTRQVQTGTGVTTTSTYGYDLANRLISSSISNNAVVPFSTSATYAYNAQGQRVTRVEDEVITHFYYTGSALLFTTVNEYVLQTQNILDPSGSLIASKRFEGQAATGQDPYADDYFFYRYDIRGSVTNIVDGEGAVVKSYDYDEFGVTTASGDAFHNEVTFTGSVADASGLLYMNARYYNPQTARFLSQDTYTGSASTPWTQHLYAYCNNNPVNMVDPTGHAPRGIRLPISIPMKPLFDEEQSKEIVRTAAVAISIADALAEYDLYQSADEAAIAVAPELYDLTYKSGLEYKANIYSLNYGSQKLYFTGMVIQGEHNNVVLPMISSTLAGSFLNIMGSGAIQNEGFIHTHPYCTRHMYGVFSGFIGDEGAALLAGRCYMLNPKDHVLYRITAEDVIRAALNGKDIAANMKDYKVTRIYDLEPYSDRYDCRKGDKR